VLSDRSHVVISLSVWEVLCEHSPAIGVDFDLPNCLDSDSFKAKVKPSDASKQTAVREHL
jgi:hypothetical protein